MDFKLSRLAAMLIPELEKTEVTTKDKKISVNPIISKVASLYEKFRNAMDYREDEVILRASIERILKRRFLFGGNGKNVAEPLIRELVWARYFQDETLSESTIEKTEKCIDLYTRLRKEILLKHSVFSEKLINEWIYHLMSSEIEHILNPNRKKELLTNFMFTIMRKNITISDDTNQTRDVQTFIAVHKTFAKNDIALLRYYLFKQFFGNLNENNVEKIASDFLTGFKEVKVQLSYPRKDRIFNYVKGKTAIFFVLEDLLNFHQGTIKDILRNEAEFQKVVFEICEAKYKSISLKVRTGIIRSVIFILFTKTFLALGIEGTFESVFYGKIIWTSTLINIGVPPILMAVMGLFIKTPDKENSKRILVSIKSLLGEDDPKFSTPLTIEKNPKDDKPFLTAVFTILWLASFILAFGAVIFILTKLHFNILSLSVFVFFLAIVSFFSYRINQSAQSYSYEEKKNILIPVVDFLFMPLIRVGRRFAEGISQLNLFLFIFDFIIETPFKGMFGFFEQWFLFLQSKREELE